MAGLLFMAFAFFSVAQAGTVRNGAQSAADAAAVAAAQDDRGRLFDGFLGALGPGHKGHGHGGDDSGDGGDWRDWLLGTGDIDAQGCAAADDFAGRNRSDVSDCEAVSRDGYDGYTVSVLTRFDTGRTFVPGASHKKAHAEATAVLRPRCSTDEGTDSHEIQLTCKGDEFTIDPGEDPDRLDLKPSDLFSVVLVG